MNQQRHQVRSSAQRTHLPLLYHLIWNIRSCLRAALFLPVMEREQPCPSLSGSLRHRLLESKTNPDLPLCSCRSLCCRSSANCQGVLVPATFKVMSVRWSPGCRWLYSWMKSVSEMSTWNLCGYGSSPLLFSCWTAWLRILKYCYWRGKKKASEKLNLVRPVAHQAEYCILPQSGSNALRFPNLKPPDL